MPSSPFDFISIDRQKRLFLPLLVLTLLAMAALQGIDQGLRTTAAPWGIVSFEIAGQPAAAQAILASWGPEGRVLAGLSLGLDFLFIPLYAATIALACGLLAAPFYSAWGRLGRALAWGQPAAALLDVIENLALIRVLLLDPAPFWPPLAAWTAAFKFFLIGAAGLYLFLTGAAAVVRLRRPA